MAGYNVTGGDSEFSIDQVNQWMRAQPWYQQALASLGQNPASVNLNKSQAQYLVRQAQANGVRVDEGAIEIDPGGNFNPRGHKLRNTLIVLGAAAAAGLTGGAALGAFGGAGAGVGGMGGLMASSAVVPSAALGAGGGLATGVGLGGIAGLAGAGYTVPSATLAANGGIPAGAGVGGLGGLAPASYTVPSATLGANGGIPAGTSAGRKIADAIGRVATNVIPAVVGRAISGGNDSTGGLSPELQQLLQMSIKRMTQQQPLFESINRQAMAGLPTAYQQK